MAENRQGSQRGNRSGNRKEEAEKKEGEEGAKNKRKEGWVLLLAELVLQAEAGLHHCFSHDHD